MRNTFYNSLLIAGTIVLLSVSCSKDGGEAENKAPTASVLPEHLITLPQNSLVMKGYAKDEDGTIVSYQWTKVDGPQSHQFVDSTLATVEIKELEKGVYRFQLKVTDNEGLFGTASTKVKVFEKCPCEPDCDPYGDPCDPWDY